MREASLHDNGKSNVYDLLYLMRSKSRPVSPKASVGIGRDYLVKQLDFYEAAPESATYKRADIDVDGVPMSLLKRTAVAIRISTGRYPTSVRCAIFA